MILQKNQKLITRATTILCMSCLLENLIPFRTSLEHQVLRDRCFRSRVALSRLKLIGGNTRRIGWVLVRVRLPYVEGLQQGQQFVQVFVLPRTEVERKGLAGLVLYRPPKPAICRGRNSTSRPFLPRFRTRSRFQGPFPPCFQGMHGSRTTATARSCAGSILPCPWKPRGS